MDFRPEDRVRLVNARIVDVERGRYYGPGVSLVIQGGKIAAMPGLPGEPPADPTGAVIDLQGMAVVPGMFNTHCHLQFGDLGEPREAQIARHLAGCLDRGVTTVRDTLCWDLDQNRTLVEKISRGELTGPRIHQATHVAPLGDTYAPRQTPMGRFIFGLIKLPVVDYGEKCSGVVAFREDAGAQEVRDAVDRAIDERGAQAIKFCDQPEHFMSYKPGAAVITAAQLEAAVDQANRRGLPTTIHNVTAAGFRNAVRAGVGSLAHLPMDASLTEADADLLSRSQTLVEPTLTVAYYMCYSMKGSPLAGHPELTRLEAYRDATMDAYIADTWPPELRKNNEGRHAMLRNGQIKVFRLIDISAPFRYMSAMIITGAANLRMLVDRGAGNRLACGTDAGPANCSPAVIDEEIAMLDFALNTGGKVRFTPADALRVATIQSARSMGVADQLGSIETGKTADLAVIDGDPLSDLQLIGRPVQALFMDGKLVVNKCGLQARQPFPV